MKSGKYTGITDNYVHPTQNQRNRQIKAVVIVVALNN